MASIDKSVAGAKPWSSVTSGGGGVLGDCVPTSPGCAWQLWHRAVDRLGALVLVNERRDWSRYSLCLPLDPSVHCSCWETDPIDYNVHLPPQNQSYLWLGDIARLVHPKGCASICQLLWLETGRSRQGQVVTFTEENRARRTTGCSCRYRWASKVKQPLDSSQRLLASSSLRGSLTPTEAHSGMLIRAIAN